MRPRSEILGLELLKYLHFILLSVEDSILLEYWDSCTSKHYVGKPLNYWSTRFRFQQDFFPDLKDKLNWMSCLMCNVVGVRGDT